VQGAGCGGERQQGADRRDIPRSPGPVNAPAVTALHLCRVLGAGSAAEPSGVCKLPCESGPAKGRMVAPAGEGSRIAPPPALKTAQVVLQAQGRRRDRVWRMPQEG
jgi:hypothetical protein